MNNTNSRRCTECTRPFEPEPRASTRQVTCADASCQRERHAKACRRWHANNGAASNHYEDVVVPFRCAQPTYQRRWRLGRRLCEIREQLGRLTEGVMAQLAATAERARALLAGALEESQSGVITHDSLPAQLELIASVGKTLEEVVRVAAALGGVEP